MGPTRSTVRRRWAAGPAEAGAPEGFRAVFREDYREACRVVFRRESPPQETVVLE